MDEEYLTMHPNAMPVQEAAMTYLFTYAAPMISVCPPAVAEQTVTEVFTAEQDQRVEEAA